MMCCPRPFPFEHDGSLVLVVDAVSRFFYGFRFFRVCSVLIFLVFFSLSLSSPSSWVVSEGSDMKILMPRREEKR